jgi:hypothetical protein
MRTLVYKKQTPGGLAQCLWQPPPEHKIRISAQA